MTLTAGEQYLLELMNRARLDPAGEAARMGVALNQGLQAGTLDSTARQVLAPNALLDAAAAKHSLWELAADVLSHVGQGGSVSKDRMIAEGYTPGPYGENLALIGLGSTQTQQSAIEDMNRTLFEGASQRVTLMNGNFRELGVGAETGTYTQNGQDFNSMALTLNFATSGPAHFLTGVAYTDIDKNAFYSIGEGSANVTFRAAGVTTTTAAAGGYALALGSSAATEVTGKVGGAAFSVTVDMSVGNVKLDVVGGATFASSGNVTLGAGINNVVLLGVANLNAIGNSVGNTLTGNSGNNALNGLQGNDKLLGLTGNDKLDGGFGNDVLTGGKAIDQMTGGVGADVFVFAANDGNDKVMDFSLADGDRLLLDDALWGSTHLKTAEILTQFAIKGTGEVVLDFGVGEVIHLLGLNGMGGLGAAIDIF